jgi:hypothetical protein
VGREDIVDAMPMNGGIDAIDKIGARDRRHSLQIAGVNVAAMIGHRTPAVQLDLFKIRQRAM